MAADKPLTNKEVQFCQAWIESGNGIAAAQKVFQCPNPNAAGQKAWYYLKKPKVRAYIRELQQEATDAARITTNRIAQALARTAFYDVRRLYDNDGKLLPPREWPDDIAAVIESVESEQAPLGVTVKKVRLAKRTEAQKILAQWLKMLGDDTTPATDTATVPLGIHLHPGSDGADG